MTATGALLGLAIGDAMGCPAEFSDINGILATHGPWQRMELPAPALITDDTQMTLAVARAVVPAGDRPGPETVTAPLREEFVAWWRSPDNNRAPGNTCLTACRSLSAPQTRWQQATVTGSKGCGANMRVAPAALVPGLTGEQRSGFAQLQAALTHGHPTALAASDLTAHAIRLLDEGAAPATLPATLPAALRAHCHEQRGTYHERWLGDLWAHAQDPDPHSYIARGWDDCLAALDRLDAALAHPDTESDPCLATGAGWIAEEALVTGLLCFLLLPGDPVAAVRRAACTSGDSDSIACLAGAFAGAHAGAGVWPAAWVDRLEHRDELLALGARWDTPVTTTP